MQLNKNEKVATETRSRKPRINFDLYFYERVGNRYHLRITPFAIVFILIAMAFGYTVLWLDGRKQTVPNVKIVVPSTTPYPSNSPIIKQVSPSTRPTADRQHKANTSRLSPSTVIRNTNEQ